MLRILILAAFLAALVGCGREMYVPHLAGEPYPDHLHLAEFSLDDERVEMRPQVVDIHVFRDDTDLVIVNSTATSYADVRVWINQRFTAVIDSIPAGETTRLSLWTFFDMWGQRFNAGGFWRTTEPTAVRLVELQLDDEQPLVGLIAIGDEPPRE